MLATFESGRNILGKVNEAWKIGRDQVVPVGQGWNQIAEHVRRGREAVQQEKVRRVFRACLAIENFDSFYFGAVMRDHVLLLACFDLAWNWFAGCDSNPYDNLAVRLIGLHQTMGFLNLIELEHTGWLGLVRV
jgi:hypothetical protein